MLSHLAATFPDIPKGILWKTELIFEGVRYSSELTEAVADGAEEGPCRRIPGGTQRVPCLIRMGGHMIARLRVDDASELAVRSEPFQGGFDLVAGDDDARWAVSFVRAPSWKALRTSDGFSFSDAGVERVGDAVVVNLAPGRDEGREAVTSSFWVHGQLARWSETPGRVPRLRQADRSVLNRLSEALAVIAERGEARHVWVAGESMLREEFDQLLRVVETCRTAVGDALTVTARCSGGDPARLRRLRDAGADSCCYNMQTGDPAIFAATLPGKLRYVGREQWFEGLMGAVAVFGSGRVASAFVVGREILPPDRQFGADRMQASLREGAEFLLDRGVMPVYAPWQAADGPRRALDPGLRSDVYLGLERDVFWLRASRHFPVPQWLLCPECSDVLLSADFDRAFGLNEHRKRVQHSSAQQHRRDRSMARGAAS